MSTEINKMMDLLRLRSEEAKKSVNNPHVTDRKPIDWKRKSANVIESDCMGYQIERRYDQIRACSDSAGYVYLVFRRGTPVKLIGTYTSPEEAKSAALLDREDECETPATNS